MSVMVGVPVKNSAIWLARFLEQLEKLEDVSRVIFSYGFSRDPTLNILQQYEHDTKHPTEIIAEPWMPGPLSAAEIAPVYKDFQEIIGEEGWEEETHFLLLDADIMHAPADLIQRLKKHDKDIIAPFVWVDRSNPRQFFDIHCFRIYEHRFHPFSPPDPNNGEPFELDSVGSCYLAKYEPFKLVDYENPHPHIRFCENALKEGYEVWADPGTEVLHLDDMKLGIKKTAIETLRGQPFNPPPYIMKDGTVVDGEQIAKDAIDAFVWGRAPK
ncbi:MAG TPA: hypothetical protein VMW50_03120 [Dehalococcoidia bacterium]|nr:hypothetical protein [Dehalococcoidia bacterium]